MYDFNQPIYNQPNSLTHLVFFGVCSKFNHSIDILPDSIVELTLDGESFSQPVNKVPNSIKKIFVNNYEQKKIIS